MSGVGQQRVLVSGEDHGPDQGEIVTVDAQAHAAAQRCRLQAGAGLEIRLDRAQQAVDPQGGPAGLDGKRPEITIPRGLSRAQGSDSGDDSRVRSHSCRVPPRGRGRKAGAASRGAHGRA